MWERKDCSHTSSQKDMCVFSCEPERKDWLSELEKLPSHPNLYRLRAPIEWEVDLLDFHLKWKQADSEVENIFEYWQTRIDNNEE